MTDSAVQLIVGLGNPGPQYLKTRHNAGFWLLDRLAAQYQISFRVDAKYKSELAKVTLERHPIWLLKPLSFMNKSGAAVAALANFYKIPQHAILIAHDELDLPPGTVRLKRGGGHGGHNGLRDVVQMLGGSDFARIRLGIGHPGAASEVVHYVLRSAPPNEQNLLLDAIDAVIKELPHIVTGGWEKAMMALHSRKPDSPK